MKCKILHESAGRIRVHLNCRRMTLHQADVLEYYLRNVDGVREVSVFDRTQDAVIVYRADRAALVHALAAFSFTVEFARRMVGDKVLCCGLVERERRERVHGRGVLVRQGRNNGPCPRPYDAQTQP